jgi:hypothetical protein
VQYWAGAEGTAGKAAEHAIYCFERPVQSGLVKAYIVITQQASALYNVAFQVPAA